MTPDLRPAGRPHALMARIMPSAFAMAVCAALLAACGGGGGGAGGDGAGPDTAPRVSGGGFAPLTGPGDTAQYFPLTQGDRWVYDRSATSGEFLLPNSIYANEVTGTREVGGASAVVLTQTDPTDPGFSIETYLNVRPGGITQLGNNDPNDTLSPQLVPYVELAFPVAIGPVSSVTGVRLPAGTDNAGNPLTLDLTQSVVNVAFETADVPAGRFAQALRQQTTIDATLRSPALGMAVPVRAVQTRWFAPGVGIVRQTLETTVDGSVSNSAGELRGYSVGGVRRGLGEPFEAIPALTPDNGEPTPPLGAPAIATDGQNFLIVTRRVSGAAAPYQTQWISTLVSLDGQLLANAELTAPETAFDPVSTQRAAVVFDGSGFVALLPRDNDFATSGMAPSLVAVRVSAAGARVADGQVIADNGAYAPALAFDGTRVLAVFKRATNVGAAGSIQGQFITPATGLADGGEFAVSAAGVMATSPALAFGAGRYLAAWSQVPGTQPGGVSASRIGTDGSVVDANGIAVRTSADCCVDQLPGVQHDGTQFLVAWRDFRAQQDGVHTNVFAARVDAAGQLLDADGIALSSTPDRIDGAPVPVREPGGGMLVSWLSLPPTQSLPELRGARLAVDGTVIASAPQGTPLWRQGAPAAATIASHDGGAMAVWIEMNAPVMPSSVRAMAIRRFGP